MGREGEWRPFLAGEMNGSEGDREPLSCNSLSWSRQNSGETASLHSP
jgi:hypothetical protein